MLRARQHCCNAYGWLYCEPQDYQAAFDEQLRLRDQELSRDPGFSGEPPGLQPWAEQQLRQLASKPFYAKQIEAQALRVKAKVDATVEQQERAALELAAKVEALSAQHQHIVSFLAASEVND